MENKARAEVNSLAAASLIFGILSVLTCVSMVFPVYNGVLAVVFSLLSRGNRKMSVVAVTGMILGITGLLLGLFLAAVLLSWLRQVLQSPEISNALELLLRNLLLFNGAGGGF